MPTRTALVTGANRGIGLATCQALARAGMRTIVTARDQQQAQAVANDLAALGHRSRGHALDVTSRSSIDALIATLHDEDWMPDVLMNNAGVLHEESAMTLRASSMEEAFAVHVLGPLMLCQSVIPTMNSRGHGRIINVSSGWGSFGEGMGGPTAYAVSKAALNALTVKLAAEAGPAVKVNAICPGWVRTRMGGAGADISPEESAAGFLWLCTLPDDGPTGRFFRFSDQIPW